MEPPARTPILLRGTSGWRDDTDIDDARPRQCTDRVCLVIFLSVVAAMGYMYQGARSEGNISKLVHGIDWMGRVCGVSPNVTDKPLLYWCVARDFVVTDGICVNSCPNSESTSHLCPGPPSQSQHVKPLANGAFDVEVIVSRTLTLRGDVPSSEEFGMYCLPKGVEFVRMFQDIPQLKGVTEHVIVALQGILQSWRFLALMAVGATLFSFATLYILAKCVEPVAYLILTVVFLLLLGTSLGFAASAFVPRHNVFTPYTTPAHAKSYALTVGGVFGVVNLLYCAVLCCTHSALRKSFYAVNKACQTMEDLPTLILAPVVQLVVCTATQVALVIGIATVLSLGKIVSSSPFDDDENGAGLVISGVSRKLEFEGWQWRWVVFWIFGSLWVQETVVALGQYAISHAVVLYVLNADEVNRVIPLTMGFINGACYHLGTLAFGGFVIGVVSLLSAACAFLARQTQAREGRGGLNYASQAACCCCVCCVEFIQLVARMTNELAYVDTAIFGTNYPEAALNVERLIAKYPVRFATAKWVTQLVRGTGTFLITLGGTAASYFVLRRPPADLDPMLHSTNVLGTTAVAGIICYTFGTCFMVTFDMVVNVLVYCGLVREDKYSIPFGPEEEGEVYVAVEAS